MIYLSQTLTSFTIFTIWQSSPAGDSTGPGGIFTIFSFLKYKVMHRLIAELTIKQAQIIARTNITLESTRIHTETRISHKHTHIIICSIVLKSWSVIFVYRNLYCLSLVESRWVLHQHRRCRWRPSLQPRSADPVMDSWGRNHRMGHTKTNTSQTQWSLCLMLVLPATPLNTAMIDLTVECSFRARPATSCY